MQQIQCETAIRKFTMEGLACPSCEAPLNFVDSVWNSSTKKRVRILECGRCRKLVWDD